MGLTYTFVSILGDLLINCMPRNGSTPLFSSSIVNFKEGWIWFRSCRNCLASFSLGIMVSVSSTYLL